MSLQLRLERLTRVLVQGKKSEAKVTTKQIVKKPVGKPKAAKKAALADKDANAGSDAEMLSDDGAGPSNGIRAAPEGSKKTASEKYTKVRALLFHPLHR